MMRLERHIRRNCAVVSIDEFRTSRLHRHSYTPLTIQMHKAQDEDGAVACQKVHSTTHCEDKHPLAGGHEVALSTPPATS